MEIENWYAAVDADGFIAQFETAIEVVEGPNLPLLGAFRYQRLPGPPNVAPPPTPTHKMRLIDGALAWVETAALDDLKARKAAEITAQRLAADSDHFTYQGKEIRTADKDMLDMLIAHARIMMGGGMPPNWPGGWKAIDNSYIPISSIDEWRPFFIAMYDTGISNFTRSQQLKARILAATTPEEVAAIHWGMDLSQPLEEA